MTSGRSEILLAGRSLGCRSHESQIRAVGSEQVMGRQGHFVSDQEWIQVSDHDHPEMCDLPGITALMVRD